MATSAYEGSEWNLRKKADPLRCVHVTRNHRLSSFKSSKQHLPAGTRLGCTSYQTDMQ